MKNMILYLICFLAEAVILLQYASALFPPRHSQRRRLCSLGVLYLVLFMVSLFEVKWLNMLLYLLANFVFLIRQYQLKFPAAIFHSFSLSAVMGMCELAVYSILERFTPHFYAQAAYFHNRILFLIFTKLLFFTVIYLLISRFKRQPKDAPAYDSKSVLLLIFIPIATIFTMLTLLSISDRYTLPPALNQMIFLCSIFLLIMNVLVFGINQYRQQKNQEYTEMQLLLLKETDSIEYYKMLLAQSENQSILIHDIKNHLQSINLLNKQGEQEKISAYIHQLLLSSDLKEASPVCSHELLSVILSRYQRQCSDHGISLHADIRTGSTNFMTDNDLTSLFCNLLDNAVEATHNIPEAFIEMSISRRENTPFVVITLINSCRTNPFSTKDGVLHTSKPDKYRHGFGLKSIRKIVDKYQGDMQMYYCQESLTFHTIITLKLPVSAR